MKDSFDLAEETHKRLFIGFFGSFVGAGRFVGRLVSSFVSGFLGAGGFPGFVGVFAGFFDVFDHEIGFACGVA